MTCAAYPRGVNNCTLEQCCALCGPGNTINCSAWAFTVDKNHPEEGRGHCNLLSWLAGTRSRNGSVVGGKISPPPPKPPKPPKPGPSPGPGPSPPGPPQTVRLSPTDDCASIVAKTPPGSTFILAPGLYREQQIVPHDGDTFIGDSATPEAVVLSGARVIGPNEIEQRGAVFVAPNRTEKPGQKAGKCDDQHPRCVFNSDLFMNSVPLLHVNSSADVNRSGTWYFDYDAHEIIFADDPTGHTLEISVSNAAFFSQHSQYDLATNVTVKNLTVKMYAVPAQSGAIGGGFPGGGWEPQKLLTPTSD